MPAEQPHTPANRQREFRGRDHRAWRHIKRASPAVRVECIECKWEYVLRTLRALRYPRDRDAQRCSVHVAIRRIHQRVVEQHVHVARERHAHRRGQHHRRCFASRGEQPFDDWIRDLPAVEIRDASVMQHFARQHAPVAVNQVDSVPPGPARDRPRERDRGGFEVMVVGRRGWQMNRTSRDDDFIPHGVHPDPYGSDGVRRTGGDRSSGGQHGDGETREHVRLLARWGDRVRSLAPRIGIRHAPPHPSNDVGRDGDYVAARTPAMRARAA